MMQHWFANPMALTLLAILPVLAALGFFARRRRRKALARLGSVTALEDRLGSLRGVCLSTGIALLVVGIAGPQWGRDWVQAAPGRDIVVVLDMSRSMLAEQPSRFERAKTALVDLSQEVQRHGGHRLGLVVFAGGAKVVCPLTHDYDHLREVLDQLDAKELPEELSPAGTLSGTRIGAAIREAVTVGHDERFRGFQDILLLSDGDDPAHDEEWRSGITAAQQARIPVHTIGIGDPEHANVIPTEAGGPLLHDDKTVLTKLNEKPLEDLARLTGGTYIAAHTKALPLGELFRTRIEPRPGHDDADGGDAMQVYRPRYTWFLGPALALLALEMLLSRRRSPQISMR
jgi:Ca-activated chloride channel family protein